MRLVTAGAAEKSTIHPQINRRGDWTPGQAPLAAVLSALDSY
jgi:hypothetical protein